MSKEVLLVVDSVSHEKGVPKDVIFGAIEAALAMATKKRYDENAEFRVSINRETGDYETYRVWTVADPEQVAAEAAESEDEDLEWNPAAQLTVEEARERKPDAQLGDHIEDPVESVE